jgi:hypothetical protein
MEVHFILMIFKMARDERSSKGAENIDPLCSAKTHVIQTCYNMNIGNCVTEIWNIELE